MRLSPCWRSRVLARSYRVISYHRRGYGGSSRVTPPFTIEQQAADARALRRHLGVSHAPVAGHSYGGAIALQLALDSPGPRGESGAARAGTGCGGATSRTCAMPLSAPLQWE